MSIDRARPPAVDAAAGTRAARLLGWPGVVLAAMPLFGVRVLPVVVLDLDAHQARQATGNGPQFDADTLVVWEWPESTGQAPPPVVAVSGLLISNPNPDGLHVFRRCGDVAQAPAGGLVADARRVADGVGGPQRDHRAPRGRRHGGGHHGRGMRVRVTAPRVGGAVVG